MNLQKSRFFRCKACGGYVGILVDDDGEGLLMHSKPKEKLGIPNSVSCPVYNRCDTEELVLTLCAGEPIDPPERFEPFVQ